MSLNFNALAHTESSAMAIPCMCACNVYACRAGDDKATLDNGKLVDRPDCHIQLYIMTQAKKRVGRKTKQKMWLNIVDRLEYCGYCDFP